MARWVSLRAVVVQLENAPADAERCAVQARHPEAVVHEARTQAGDLLYTAYHLDGPGLPAGSTPAGTILLPVAPAPCG